MKKIIFIIALVIVFGFIAYLFALFSTHKVNELAFLRTSAIVDVIKQFQTEKGEFPNNIDSYIASKGLDKEIQFAFLKRKIHIFQHEGYYIVEYYHFPLGPFHGFSFKDDEWFFAE